MESGGPKPPRSALRVQPDPPPGAAGPTAGHCWISPWVLTAVRQPRKG